MLIYLRTTSFIWVWEDFLRPICAQKDKKNCLQEIFAYIVIYYDKLRSDDYIKKRTPIL